MEFIKAYWEQQGSAHQSSHLASWGDRYAIELEIETISRFIKGGDRVLDIGCANFSTFRQHEMNLSCALHRRRLRKLDDRARSALAFGKAAAP